MTVSEGPARFQEKEVKSRYPVVAGLVLGTTKISGRNPYLVAESKSLISSKDKSGL